MLDGHEHGGIIAPEGRRLPGSRAVYTRVFTAANTYVLLCALRRIGLAHTQFADATCDTIRLKLLKLGALVRISVRRIKLPRHRPALAK